MTNWRTHINQLNEYLLSLSVSDMSGKIIDTDMAFKQLQNYALGVLERKKTIYFIGNGSSASIASDTASILAKNTGINTESFNNFSLLTAIASDSGYDEIFSEPLRKKMVAGDMLVAICSSGDSPNILCAVKEALKIGSNVCTLSAINPKNTLRSCGILNFFIPAENRLNVSQCHMGIMNYWIDQLISILIWQEEVKYFQRKSDNIYRETNL